MSLMTAEDRAEWLAWRSAGIGGSDVSAILGLSRWASPWTVFLDKIGEGEDREPTQAMWWGQVLEDDIEARFMLETGLSVYAQQERAVHPDHPWMRCTLDGRVRDDAFGVDLGIFEAKSTADSVDDWAMQGGVPIEYACQATWNMVVTQTTQCHMAVLHCAFGLELKVYELHLDQSDADEVIDAASQFWFKHVQRRVPPPADAHVETARAMAKVWPARGGVIEADEEWRRMVADACAAKARKAAAEQEERQALNNLRAAIGENTDVVVYDPDTGKPKAIATWRADKNGVRTLRTPGEK